MPVYEFRCRSCQHEFQDLFFSSEINLSEIECPGCTGHEVEKLMSMFSSDSQSAGHSSSSPSGKSCSSAKCPPGCRCH